MIKNITNSISIIICTYNRYLSLQDTLESLLKQECDGSFKYEVIVVDNNSKDKTREVVKTYAQESNGRLKYVFEPNQGLSYARNRGIREADGGIIAFSDDDVIVDKAWIKNIFRTFLNNNCDAIGGRILPLYISRPPDWITKNMDLLNGPLVLYDYGLEKLLYDKSKMIPFFGANMAFKKEVFNTCGLFKTDLGVGQGKIGEETEFFRRLEKVSNNLYYCGNALIWHKVDTKRMSLRYIAKWWISSGRYTVATDYNKPDYNITFCFGFPRYLIREIITDIFLLPIVFFKKRQLLKIWRKLFWNIGRILEYRKNYKNE